MEEQETYYIIFYRPTYSEDWIFDSIHRDENVQRLNLQYQHARYPDWEYHLLEVSLPKKGA